MVEDKTQESAREYTNFERLVIEYIAFNDGFINTRLRARRMLDGGCGERQEALSDERILGEFVRRKVNVYGEDGEVRPLGDAVLLAVRSLLGADAPPLGEQNTDDLAVDSFARSMKEKLAGAREKGRSGWEGMDPTELSSMLREHVEKGDPRDVANFCMMLWHHGARIAPAVASLTDEQRAAQEPVAWRHKWTNDHAAEWAYKEAGPKTDELRIGIPGVLGPDSHRECWEPLYAQPQPMPQTDAARDVLTRAKRMLEGYADSYASMERQSRMNGDEGRVSFTAVMHDIRNNMAGWCDAEIERLDREAGE